MSDTRCCHQGVLLLQLAGGGNEGAAGSSQDEEDPRRRLGRSPRQLDTADLLRRPPRALHLGASPRQRQLLPRHRGAGRVWDRQGGGVQCEHRLLWGAEPTHGGCRVRRSIQVCLIGCHGNSGGVCCLI